MKQLGIKFNMSAEHFNQSPPYALFNEQHSTVVIEMRQTDRKGPLDGNHIDTSHKSL